MLKVISSSPGELEPVFKAMLENATRICEAKFGMLFWLRGRGVPHASRCTMRRRPMPRSSAQRGRYSCRSPAIALGRMLQTKAGDPHRRHAGRAGYSTASRLAVAGLAGARSTRRVPMLKDDELVGAIVIYRQEVRPFTDKQIELVQNFAAQAVIAIENTRLLNELRQRTDDLTESLEQQTATSEVLKVISSSPGELEPVFQAMLENAMRICDAKFGSMSLFEGDAFRVASPA